MNQCQFNELTEAHLPEVLAIYNDYVVKSTATFHLEPIAAEEMRSIVFFDKPRYRSYVITENNTICGYCILTNFKKREAYDISAEVTVYLRPESTGRGYGSAALQHLEQLARQHDIHSLIAIICGENEASRRLFAKNGYSQCACYKEVGKKFGRLLDVVCFQKVLS